MFTIALKDIRLFLNDKRGLLMAFAVPIALITLFAFAFGGAGRGDEAPEPRELVIADMDQSDESKMMIAKLDSLEEFLVIITTKDSAEMYVKKGDIAAAFIVKEGFEDSLHAWKAAPLEMIYDEAEGPEVAIMQGALYGRLNAYVGERRAMLPEMRSQAPDSMFLVALGMAEKMRSQRLVSVTQTSVIREKQNSAGLVHAVAGTAIMMLLFSVTAMGMSMLDEKQEGTLKKLIMAPISPTSILLGKMISVNIISMAQLAIMFIYGWLVFGLDITSHVPSLLLMIFCTAFACSSFGVFLVSFAKSRNQVQGMSTLIIMTMSALGGSMVPSFVMPVFMQKLGVITVNYWGVQGFYDIFWRDLAFTDPTFLTRVVVLLCIGIVLNLVAVRLFKKNVLSLA